MAIVFHDMINERKYGDTIVNWIDRNPGCNKIENLKWGSDYSLGKIDYKSIPYAPIDCRIYGIKHATWEKYEGIIQASSQSGENRQSIIKVCTGQRPKAKYYEF